MAGRGLGSLRRGQVVTSYGPGATIDLPETSVIIGGLEWWRGHERERIVEPRLEEKVAQVLGVARIALHAPPAEPDTPYGPLTGIQVETFPLWFVADLEARDGLTRSRPLVHARTLVGGKVEIDGKKHEVTPVRFVQACSNGHIADIEWREFVHAGSRSCPRQLWLDEFGTSGDLADARVRCECGRNRLLAEATLPNVLGQCRGRRPWLPQDETCVGKNGVPERMRLLIRTASNAYFPQRLSVVSLPESGDRIRTAITSLWQTLSGVTSADTVATLRQIVPAVGAGLRGIDDATAVRFIQAERDGVRPPRRPIKYEEFDALTQAEDSLGEDRPEGSFYARREPLPERRPKLLEHIDRIVLVHRLREVTAQVGFTRFDAVVPDITGELDLPVRPAALAIEPTWLPAVETRGEGVFVSFTQTSIDAWRSRPEVRARADEFRLALPSDDHGVLPDATYVMLHSLAHLLITAVALDCGYNTSSIRERIYVAPGGCGILLYTGTSDAEGTLGGLVQTGRRFERYLRMALELGRLCANDPVCAQRSPNSPHDEQPILGAACHGCLLISETCCERRNEYLDRSLVVATVQGLGCEFFRDGP